MSIYIDGSCSGNPGPGGFGIVKIKDNTEKEIEFWYQEQFPFTTNNEMELRAALYALAKFGVKDEPFIPVVYSDSAYAINTLTKWKNSWKKNGWRKSDKKIPENLEIIKKYDELEELGYKIELKKVSGHIGIYGNELADRLARGLKIEVRE